MKSLGDGNLGMDWRFHASNSISSLACSLLCLARTHRRGYSVGEVGVDPELLPSRESDRLIQNGEARGELRSHSSHVRIFNTCNTHMHLLRMT